MESDTVCEEMSMNNDMCLALATVESIYTMTDKYGLFLYHCINIGV